MDQTRLPIAPSPDTASSRATASREAGQTPRSGAVEIVRLGMTSYSELWETQRRLQRELIAHEGPETLIICQHPPTITVGRSGARSNILASESDLRAQLVEVFEVERGGDVTYHGPGQTVVYPIINLSLRRRDVGWYMRSLEEVILATLQLIGITGIRVAGRTGVWIGSKENGIDSKKLAESPGLDSRRKIASIGVRISRWCTMHGLALNIRNQQRGFSLINPCGFTDIGVTSVEEEIGCPVDDAMYRKIEDSLVDIFLDTFQIASRS